MSYLEESFGASKLINEAHDVASKKVKERKKSLLYLIFQYLKDEGFQKYPKIWRQQARQDSEAVVRGTGRMCKSAKTKSSKSVNYTQKLANFKDQINGANILATQPLNTKEEMFQEALPPHITATPEMQELANLITREIVTTNLSVKWTDIIGLEHVKSMIRETIVYPQKYPNMFHGILAPWKAILLYGPPGTGKTMLAKAVASECKTTFFNISSSSIVSKWRGESEKLVRVLFELAHHYSPSTIFMDEVDSIACHSGSEDHEGTRRLRAELLIHLDGLASEARDNVFLLATTNSPWNLDKSLLRRFEKRILVDVPNLEDRESHIKYLLPSKLPNKNGYPAITCSIDYNHVAQVTEGYTGSDLKVACREAAMSILREVLPSFETSEHGTRSPLKTSRLKTLMTLDLEDALKKTKPTTVGLLHKYHSWENELGSL